jgi:hypothetical protein
MYQTPNNTIINVISIIFVVILDDNEGRYVVAQHCTMKFLVAEEVSSFEIHQRMPVVMKKNTLYYHPSMVF